MFCSARRTKVIDDESDYYASDNKWLSIEERERLQKKRDAMHAKRHASRRDKTITFDFAGKFFPSVCVFFYNRETQKIKRRKT